MHHPILNKYLLVSTVALTVLVFDAYIGHSRQQPQATSSTTTPKPFATPNTAPSAEPPRTSLLLRAATAADYSSPTADQPSSLEGENLAQKLQAIETDYQAVALPILEKSPAIITPDDRVRLAYLDSEKHADLGELLSPTELEIYQNISETAPKRR